MRRSSFPENSPSLPVFNESLQRDILLSSRIIPANFRHTREHLEGKQESLMDHMCEKDSISSIEGVAASCRNRDIGKTATI
jgi:hypothetical protein